MTKIRNLQYNIKGIGTGRQRFITYRPMGRIGTWRLANLAIFGKQFTIYKTW